MSSLNNEVQVGRSKVAVPYVLLIVAMLGMIGVGFKWGGEFSNISNGIKHTSERMTRLESANEKKIERIEQAIRELQEQSRANSITNKRIEELLKQLLLEKQKEKN